MDRRVVALIVGTLLIGVYAAVALTYDPDGDLPIIDVDQARVMVADGAAFRAYNWTEFTVTTEDGTRYRLEVPRGQDREAIGRDLDALAQRGSVGFGSSGRPGWKLPLFLLGVFYALMLPSFLPRRGSPQVSRVTQIAFPAIVTVYLAAMMSPIGAAVMSVVAAVAVLLPLLVFLDLSWLHRRVGAQWETVDLLVMGAVIAFPGIGPVVWFVAGRIMRKRELERLAGSVQEPERMVES